MLHFKLLQSSCYHHGKLFNRYSFIFDWNQIKATFVVSKMQLLVLITLLSIILMSSIHIKRIQFTYANGYNWQLKEKLKQHTQILLIVLSVGYNHLLNEYEQTINNHTIEIDSNEWYLFKLESFEWYVIMISSSIKLFQTINSQKWLKFNSNSSNHITK